MKKKSRRSTHTQTVRKMLQRRDIKRLNARPVDIKKLVSSNMGPGTVCIHRNITKRVRPITWVSAVVWQFTSVLLIWIQIVWFTYVYTLYNTHVKRLSLGHGHKCNTSVRIQIFNNGKRQSNYIWWVLRLSLYGIVDRNMLWFHSLTSFMVFEPVVYWFQVVSRYVSISLPLFLTFIVSSLCIYFIGCFILWAETV